MKLRFLPLIFAMLLICSSVPLVTEAQSNHSLEWGVDVDEEFTYVMQRAYFADPSHRQFAALVLPFVLSLTLGEKVTLRVTSLGSIPEMVNDSLQIPDSMCDLERSNDSVSIATGLIDYVIPIGDWDFVNQLSNFTSLEGVTLVETDEEWGTTGVSSFQAGDGSIVTHTVDIRYEKENGTLNYLRHRFSTLGTDMIDIIIVNWHPGMPTVVAGNIQTPTILIFAIAAVVGVIVFIIVFQCYRSRKPLVQKLGE